MPRCRREYRNPWAVPPLNTILNGHSSAILGGGQVDAEAAAAALCRQANRFTAVTSGDLADQRQAKATAAAILARLFEAIEGFEDALALGRRHAGPVVGHFQHGAAGFGGDRNRDRPVACITPGVFEEVADQPAQQQSVARDANRYTRRLEVVVRRFLGGERQKIDGLVPVENGLGVEPAGQEDL